MNRYIARTGDAGLLRGLPLWLSLRAFIRAHVAARRGDDGGPLLAAAQAHLAPPPPRLVAIGGLQGTGKSTLARAVAPELGAAPGALVLRSDEIRKRQAGVAPETTLPATAYTAAANEAVFSTLQAQATQALADGHAVVADAVFLRQAERSALGALTPDFQGVWLTAPVEVLRARIAARHHDASDANIAVLEMTASRNPGDMTWMQLDAAEGTEAALRKTLDLPPLAPP